VLEINIGYLSIVIGTDPARMDFLWRRIEKDGCMAWLLADCEELLNVKFFKNENST
jgi:hypothetical protein